LAKTAVETSTWEAAQSASRTAGAIAAGMVTSSGNTGDLSLP
jgi:hypothetical protein